MSKTLSKENPKSKYPTTGYNVPQKNILVISCMDLRLTDDLVKFLHHDNLQNRYDHFILAGASLTYSAPKLSNYTFEKENLASFNQFKPWQDSLNNHLQLAVALHEIEDVYIVEHEDCGAYKHFLDNPGTNEIECHQKFAYALAEKIEKKKFKYVRKNKDGKLEEKDYQLHVHGFFIDMRGNVQLLFTHLTKHPKKK